MKTAGNTVSETVPLGSPKPSCEPLYRELVEVLIDALMGPTLDQLRDRAAILIAAASNNVVKGIYAFTFAHRQAGTQGLCLLLGLAALGLLPLFWLFR